MQNVENVILVGTACTVFSRGRKDPVWYVTVPGALYGPLAIRKSREEAIAQAMAILAEDNDLA